MLVNFANRMGTGCGKTQYAGEKCGFDSRSFKDVGIGN